jgi:hypothetical protein
LLTAGACTKSQPEPEEHINVGPAQRQRDSADPAQPREPPIEDRVNVGPDDPPEDPEPPIEEHVNVGPKDPSEGPEGKQSDDAPAVVPDGALEAPGHPPKRVNPGPIRDPVKRPEK